MVDIREKLKQLKSDIDDIEKHRQESYKLGFEPYSYKNTAEAIEEERKATAIFSSKYKYLGEWVIGYPEGNDEVDFLKVIVAYIEKELLC